MTTAKRIPVLLLPVLLLAALIPFLMPVKALADDPVWFEAYDATGGGAIIVGSSVYENSQHHVQQYERNANVKLEALASQYYEFEGWYVSGDGFSSYWTYSNPLYIDLDHDNMVVEAHFEPEMCVLCIDVDGDGEFYYDGAWRTYVDTSVPAGTYVGLDVNPGVYSRFAGWSDGAGKTVPYYFYVYGDVYLTANFELIPYYNLTLSVNDSSMGQISYVSHPGGGYEGDYIKLEAQAFKDYYFCGWTDGNTGAPVSANEAYEFNIYGDTNLVANFDSIYAKRKIVTLPGEGSGIMPDYEVQTGTDFTLPECTFTPPYGKTFDQWNVGAPGTVIKVNSDMTITAQWKELPSYIVHIEPNGGTGYIPDPWIYQGYTYALPECTFDPPEGKVFDTWDIGAPGTEITVNGETWIYAQWKDPEKITYSCSSGNNSSWKSDSKDPLVFVFNRSKDDDTTFSHFSDGKGSVSIDGVKLDASQYTVASGSLKLTLSPEYLKTLAFGTHVIEVTFDDGSVQAQFKAVEAKQDTNGGNKGGTDGGDPKPTTEDPPWLVIGLGVLCAALLAVIIALLATRKKGNHSK